MDWSFKGADNTPIYTRAWLPEKPIAIVQVSHGMAEETSRYAEFAAHCLAHGIGVIANDHRGHGQSAKSIEALGQLADANGFELLVEDMHLLTKKIRDTYPDCPIILLGHSMGSFASQIYTMRYQQTVQGLILSGSNGKQGPILSIGLLLAKALARMHGRNKKSEFLHHITFGNYNRAFRPSRTDFDWLSRDEAAVDAYIENPYCGTVFPIGFYVDFFTGLHQLEDKNISHNVPQIPTLIISGEEDPVGKNIEELIQRYNKTLLNVETILYPKARHELFQETNRQDVFEDVIQWILNLIH